MKNEGMYATNQSIDFEQIAQQQCDLIKKVVPVIRKMGQGATAYRLERNDSQSTVGIWEVQGELQDDNVVAIRFEILQTNDSARINANEFFRYLSELNEKTHLSRPVQSGKGPASLWVEMKVQASLMSMSRSTNFLKEVENINRMAIALQKEIPELVNHQDLLEKYKHVADAFEPVIPYALVIENVPLIEWLAETLEMHNGGLCQAIVVKSVLQEKFVLAALSHLFLQKGNSLGHTILPVIGAIKLPEFLKQAPGAVAIPAVALAMGTNPYERGNEIQSLLQALTFSITPVFFTGEESQLQTLFQGGQGGKSDPLLPVVRRLPPISVNELICFGVENEASRNGGLSGAAKEACIQLIMESFSNSGQSEIERLLPSVIIDTVKKATKSLDQSIDDINTYKNKLRNRKQSLSGLTDGARVERFAHVQEKYNELLVDPKLPDYFNAHIYAQEDALSELCTRLQMEALTRPLYQPIRYCAQGTPGTGKSESTVLLAKLLEVPFINIDAASIPDFYTASAQLLGSGRGIVGSHQSGRLEQAAKHRIGAVVEISDLDHATPAVRSALADLFLQLLETGEAQSAAGAMFSCANLIFVFTINLPNGQDEFVRRGMGFNTVVNDHEVRQRVQKELKKTFSTAFISRIGNPVIFNPLEGSAKSKIVKKACNSSLTEAAQRLNVSYMAIDISSQTIEHILDQCTDLDLTSGARGIMEKTRTIVAEAVLEQSVSIRNQNLETLQLITKNNKTFLSLK